MGCRANALFDNKRVWEFRYKMQYEEPIVKVASSDDDDTLLLIWMKVTRKRKELLMILIRVFLMSYVFK
jgi:hypothetical protein